LPSGAQNGRFIYYMVAPPDVGLGGSHRIRIPHTLIDKLTNIHLIIIPILRTFYETWRIP